MLRRIFRTALCTCSITLPILAQPTATTGPNFRLILAPKQLTSYTGFALMGEIGEKTARVNATLGYQLGGNQRLKLSVDQLCQKLTYDFFNGNSHAWVQQIAAGASYKYFLDDEFFDSVDIGGWYSNSQDRSLSSTVLTSETTTQTFERQIAGAEAWHAYLGTTLFPWDAATLGLAVVYDNVDYRRKTYGQKVVSGAGVTVDFNQRLFQYVDLNIKGDIFQPYQHVGSTLNWTVPTNYGDCIVGLYGDYTQGRKGLPNDTSFGIQVNLAFGDDSYITSPYRGYFVRDTSRPRQDLLEWIADPAVLMPIVLAIGDECSPPLSFFLPNVTVDLGPYTINTGTAFQRASCAAIKYSASGLPPGANIDEDSGIISGVNLGLFSTPFNVTVKGYCVCGSATSSFILTYETL